MFAGGPHCRHEIKTETGFYDVPSHSRGTFAIFQRAIIILAHDQDFAPRHLLVNSARSFQSIYIGHGYINQDYVGSQPRRFANRIRSISRFAADNQSRMFVQQRA